MQLCDEFLREEPGLGRKFLWGYEGFAQGLVLHTLMSQRSLDHVYRDNHRCRCHRCRLRRGRRVSSLDVRTHAYRYSITGIATAPAMTPGVS